jgi:DinB family protein
MTNFAAGTMVEKSNAPIKPANSRAAKLADRILLGASTLAAFAEGLTDAEWVLPISENDKRNVGVIVHHVASMYPIETDAAQAVAGGKELMDVTWDVIAGVNAQHATENGTVGKAETIELLRRNSGASAEAIRQLTDEQLDTAAPFGLSYGAPVTVQFVIEDHALRHSWHHLAKIKLALGR